MLAEDKMTTNFYWKWDFWDLKNFKDEKLWNQNKIFILKINFKRHAWRWIKKHMGFEKEHKRVANEKWGHVCGPGVEIGNH